VRQPEGSRHVDQGRGAPPRHRRRAKALRLNADALAICDHRIDPSDVFL
jgi:hypothetical protein